MLARVEDQGQADEALEALWPRVPSGGTVALLAMPVGPQGELGLRALPLWLIEAAARRLGSAGAQVRIVCVPGRLDEGRPFAEQVQALEARGLDVVIDAAATWVQVGGEHIASASVLGAVVTADHVAVLAPAQPHRHLTLSGPMLAVADALERESELGAGLSCLSRVRFRSGPSARCKR